MIIFINGIINFIKGMIFFYIYCDDIIYKCEDKFYKGDEKFYICGMKSNIAPNFIFELFLFLCVVLHNIGLFLS